MIVMLLPSIQIYDSGARSRAVRNASFGATRMPIARQGPRAMAVLFVRGPSALRTCRNRPTVSVKAHFHDAQLGVTAW